VKVFSGIRYVGHCFQVFYFQQLTQIEGIKRTKKTTVLQSLKRGQHKNEKIGTGVVSISDDLKETSENIRNISKRGGVQTPIPSHSGAPAALPELTLRGS